MWTLFFVVMGVFNTVVWISDRWWVSGISAVACAWAAALTYREEYA